MRLTELKAAQARLDWQAELLAHEPKPEAIPRSQLGQDLFVLLATSFMSEGYFVEFGAGNGIGLSNTWILERSFGWNGIVAEPARGWHEQLRSTRHCVIDTRCVWEASGLEIPFAETSDPFLSSIREFAATPEYAAQQRDAMTYPVETISLNDLLDEHSAPGRIDYMSVDTEGTELEILSTFDFDRYEVRVLTVEHA
ncbi:MAG TPA: FkbM family methyltransferase, partial [Gaiellaceae bacterium]|nr:FkbM family methyltransferase [Gaiellaceae bacterium]